MKKLYSLLILLFFGLTAQSQSWDWVQPLGANSSPVAVLSSTVDDNGNLYVSGYFYDTINAVNNQVICTDTSYGCAFIAKLDPGGNFIWANKESHLIYVNKITTDNKGNSYVAGYLNGFFNRNIPFGNTNVVLRGLHAGFVAKYDSVGSLKWINSAGGIADYNPNNPVTDPYDFAKSVSVDTSGNVYVSGYVSDSAQFGNIPFNPDSLPGTDRFLARYNNQGVLQWVRKSHDFYSFWDVVADNSGNIFTNGHKANVLQYDSAGNAGWQNITNANSRTITTDSQGNVYIAGSFRDSIRFSNGAYFTNTTTSSAFAAKLSPAGNIIWATPLQNVQTSSSGYVDAHKVAVDSHGYVYMAGEFSGNLATPTDTVYGNTSIFVARISPTGVLESVATGGSNSNQDRLISIKADTNQVTIIGNTNNGIFGMHYLPGPNDFIAKLSFSKITGTSKSLKINSTISVYPNPAKDNLTVELPENVNQAQVKLYNLQGQKVLEQHFFNSKTELQLPKLASGCYLLQVQSSEKVWQQKLMVE